MKLVGIFPPICTPFDSDGAVALSKLRQNIEKYNASPISGYAVTGTTGESASLSAGEKLDIWETVRAAADRGKLLIAGTGVQSARETISLAAAAAERGFDAALVLTPHYYKSQMLRPESQETFFLKVADTAKLPILVYNFPQTTGIDLSVDLIVRMAQHPNIIGLKESSTDLEKIEKLIAALPSGFPVLVGGSAVFHSCLALGAAGGILAIANALPHPTGLIYDLYKSGDISGSREAQASIFDAAGIAARHGIQGLKYAMDLRGYYGGMSRLPLLPISAEQKLEIEKVFRGLENRLNSPRRNLFNEVR